VYDEQFTTWKDTWFLNGDKCKSQWLIANKFTIYDHNSAVQLKVNTSHKPS